MWKKTKHTFEKEVIMIVINIDVMLAKRKMSVTQLSEKVGISLVNMSVLKNGRAKGIKFLTLDAICKAAGLSARRSSGIPAGTDESEAYGRER